MMNMRYDTILTGALAASIKARGLTFLLLASMGAGTAAASGPVISVVCTTTHLLAIVNAVGGDLVAARTIVPFGMCPGHFDLSPGEVENIRRADIILAHGFERFLNGFSGEIDEKLQLVNVKGNWMIPDIHKKAAVEIANMLATLRPDSGDAFTKNRAEYEARIDSASRELESIREKVRGTPVLSSEMNGEFIEWMGMNVVAIMRRDEDVSLKAMSEIIGAARREKARLVIDNRQSAGKVGETIARELGLARIVLNNFPEISGEPGRPCPYIETLKRNCEAVRNALKLPLP